MLTVKQDPGLGSSQPANIQPVANKQDGCTLVATDSPARGLLLYTPCVEILLHTDSAQGIIRVQQD